MRNLHPFSKSFANLRRIQLKPKSPPMEKGGNLLREGAKGGNVENVENDGENNSPQGFHLADLSPQQLSQLGMFRDGKGDYFHVSNTEGGGYRLSPATQESVAGAVAGIQRQAQQNQQNDRMKKISENAVDQFQVNIQARVRKIALSSTVYIGFVYLQGIGQAPKDCGL